MKTHENRKYRIEFECAERLGDACGAACPSATSSPSRSGLSFTPTLISFVPLGGFERCIQEAANNEAPPPLSEEKYGKCIGGKTVLEGKQK